MTEDDGRWIWVYGPPSPVLRRLEPVSVYPTFSSPVVVCRPALSSDKVDVLEFTKFIWDGRDYIKYVWDEWFADPQGLLAVAEYGGHCVGLGKISISAPGQWWLQGLRVDPKFQGLKISSHIHRYLDDWWLEHGDGVVRLMTSSKRVKVHHLCEKFGYTKILEVKEFETDSLDEACENFQPARKDEISAALKTALESPVLALGHGLFDRGWDALHPSEDILASIQQEGLAFWWRDGEGLLLGWDDENADGKVLGLSLPACSMEVLPELLLDARRLAAQLGRVGVFWIAPLEPEILSAAGAAGYQHHVGHSGYLYEKWSPLSNTHPVKHEC